MRRTIADGMDEDAVYEHRHLIPPVQIFISVAMWWVPITRLFDGVLFDGRFEPVLDGVILVLLGIPLAFYVVATRWANHWVRIDSGGVWIDGELAIPAGRITAVVHGVDDHTAWTRFVGADGVAPRGRNVTELVVNIWRLRSWSFVRRHPEHGVVLVPRDSDHCRVSWLSGAVVVTDELVPHQRRSGRDAMRLGWFLISYRPKRLREALVAIAPRVDSIEGWEPVASPVDTEG